MTGPGSKPTRKPYSEKVWAVLLNYPHKPFVAFCGNKWQGQIAVFRAGENGEERAGAFAANLTKLDFASVVVFHGVFTETIEPVKRKAKR